MSSLLTLLAFFACPADKQIEMLDGLPKDRGAANYFSNLNHNPLLISERALNDEAEQADDEPMPDFLARTGLPEDTSRTALLELLVYSQLLGQSLDFEKVFLLEGAQRVLDVVPHFSFDLPATVAKRKRQVRLARLLRLDLFADDDEARGHYFIFESGTVGEEKLFHEDFGASRVSR